MNETFNAKEMNTLANSYVKKAPNPMGETINNCIKFMAKMGRHSVDFVNKEKINYVETHQEEYTALGFGVIKDCDYGFPVVTISW